MILETTNLSKSFGAIVAVDNISISIDKGSAYGLLGPNGSGKTTLLRIISGAIQADSGEMQSATNLKVVYFDQHRGISLRGIKKETYPSVITDGYVYWTINSGLVSCF